MPASLDIAVEERELLRQQEKARLGDLRPQIVAICERYNVARLSLFGSLLHESEFGPDSDFDFLVEFLPGVSHGLEFVGMILDLEDLLSRRVDMGKPQLLSRYIRDEVLAEAEVFYREETWLRDMLDAARLAHSVVAGESYDAFASDFKINNAAVFQLLIISEAAKQVSETTCQQHPEVNWRRWKRTHDTIVHAYFSIDLEVVWDIATKGLPPLIGQLEAILNPSQTQGGN